MTGQHHIWNLLFKSWVTNSIVQCRRSIQRVNRIRNLVINGTKRERKKVSLEVINIVLGLQSKMSDKALKSLFSRMCRKHFAIFRKLNDVTTTWGLNYSTIWWLLVNLQRLPFSLLYLCFLNIISNLVSSPLILSCQSVYIVFLIYLNCARGYFLP